MITIPAATPSALEHAVDDLRQELRQALGLPPALTQALLDAPQSPCRLLTRLVHTLPASQADPYAGAAGLVRRALGCALQAVLQLRQLPPAVAPQQLVGTLLAALVRDLGSLLRMQVVDADGAPWSHQGYLADWLQERAYPPLRITISPGARDGGEGHGAAGVAYLALLVPGRLLAWLGAPVLQTVMCALAGSRTPAAAGLQALLGSSSTLAHARESARLRRQAALVELPLPYRYGVHDRAWDVIACCRALHASGGLAGSHWEGPLLVTPSHSLLVLGSDPRRSSLPALVQALHAHAPTAWGDAARGEPLALQEPVVAALGAAELADGLRCCLEADPGAPSQPPRMVHQLQVHAPDATRSRRCQGLIVRNRALWGAGAWPPVTHPGLAVACFRDRRQLPSIDAEDIGALALPDAELMPCWRELSAPQRCAPEVDEAHAILDLGALSAQLVRSVAALPAVQGERARQARWQRLAALCPQRLPPALVLEGLEAVAAQLEELSG